jgi:hypothetical protein
MHAHLLASFLMRNSRPTIILALVQTLAVTGGLAALGIVLKGCGYPDGERIGVRWNSPAVFLREHGWWLLCLPVLWSCYAVAAQRKDSGLLSRRAALIAGVCIPVCVVAAFLHAALNPYTLPMIHPAR